MDCAKQGALAGLREGSFVAELGRDLARMGGAGRSAC